MNILLTGNLSSLAPTFVKELSKRKHRIVLVSGDANQLDVKVNNAIVHSIDPASNVFRDAISSYSFDVVVFISTREEQLNEHCDLNIGHQLDGLRNTLELCKSENLKHFFYISSTEVYGNTGDLSECASPEPSSLNGQILLAGEQYCRFYHDQFGVNTSIVRLTNIYGPNEKTGLLYGLISTCNNKSEVDLPALENYEISLLHVLDIVDFLIRAIDEEYAPESLVVNLSSSNPIKCSDLAQLLQNYYPEVTFNFPDEDKVHTKPVKVFSAKNIYYWIDEHRLDSELEKIVEASKGEHLPKRSNLKVIGQKLFNYQKILRWVELILGAVLTQLLSEMTGTLIQYKYVDFRLLFVVIMASIYGLQFSLLAALLMSLSLFYTWYQLKIEWSLIIYNVGNWFPLVLYFVTGLAIGYNHDRTEAMIANEKKQANLIYGKYQFLYEVFNEIRKLKDEFREQVIGYRDSFGKIYTITRELDTLQEQDVYFKALTILEDLMENNNIAIYCLEPDLVYARLEVSSTSLNGSLSKSLKLSDFPEAVKSIEEGTIFQNIPLLPNYPAYIAPILNNSYPFNVPVALIVIWSVKFEQYSTYYYNLFKVICGLIQASLLRATKFLDANYERMYMPSTRIMKPDAFEEVLRTRAAMNKNKITVDQLVILEESTMDYQDLYLKVSEGIRAADVVGMRTDGCCYVLLSQADRSAAKQVIARLQKLGVNCRLLNTHELLFIESLDLSKIHA